VLADVKVWPAIAVDVIAVVVFAIIGRSSHHESNDLLGVALTAWPFLAGCLIGVLVSRAWRSPAALRTGVVIWLCTVSAGMLLRAVTGRGVALVFIVVATITLAVLLLGWRAAFAAIQKARRPTSARESAHGSPNGEVGRGGEERSDERNAVPRK
jgi:peptidoglycan/LPS O-acetylase OafA/YrhL